MDNSKKKLTVSEVKKYKDLHELNKNVPDYIKKIAIKFNKTFLSLELRNSTYDQIKKYESSIYLKNVEKSRKYRMAGNLLFQQERFAEAMDEYNRALFYAPFNPEKPFQPDNIDFVFCIANRSAAYLKLNHHVFSLLDIELAIRLNYPKTKGEKIKNRKIACYEGVRNCGKDDIEFQFNEERCELHYLSINKTFMTETSIMLASTDIKPGDIVFEEYPLFWSLNKELFKERCYYCLRIIEFYSFPCYTCNQIRFCSKECSELSWNEGHFFECNSFPVIESFSSSFKFESIKLAVRELIKLDLYRFFTELRRKPIETFGFTNDRKNLINQLYPEGRLIDYYNKLRKPENYIKIDSSIKEYEDQNFEPALELLHKKVNVKTERKAKRYRKNNLDYFQEIIKDLLERPILITEHESEFFYQTLKRFIVDFDLKAEMTDKNIKDLAQIVIFMINKCEMPQKLIGDKYCLADIELFGAMFIIFVYYNETHLIDILQRDVQIINTPDSNLPVIYKDIEHRKIGKGFYPIFNRLKHDCEPNCQVNNFDGQKLVISSLTEIKKGDRLTINRLGEFDYTLDVNSYGNKKFRYLKSIKHFAYNCIKCKEGSMSILRGTGIKLVDCIKCHFFFKIRDRPIIEELKEFEKPITEEDEKIIQEINGILEIEEKHKKKLKNVKLLLMRRLPDFITIESCLVAAYRDYKKIYCKNNEFLAKLKFDLAFCYMQMKNFKKSIDFAMGAFNTWKLLKRTYNVEYFFGLIKIIDVQYYFIMHYDKVPRELSIEEKLTFNFHTENIQTNLEFFLNNRDKYFADKIIKRNIVEKFQERLHKIIKINKK